MSCDASNNVLDNINFGGYRIGVVDFDTGSCYTFTNKKAVNIQEAEAFAVLKTVEVAASLNYKKIIIQLDNKSVAENSISGKASKFIEIANSKGIDFILKWVPRTENSDADLASRQKINVTPKSEWI